MYERISGRSGDPSKRLGEALAGSAKASSGRREQLNKSASERMVEGHIQTKLWLWGAGGVLGLVAVLWGLFR